MNLNRPLHLVLLILATSSVAIVQAQTGFDLKIDKPAPYEERVLKAEKTGEKPLKAPKRFLQNLTTHYNYYFNASTKLNEVIEGAKQGFKEDYTILLPFYNYTLDETAENSMQLDSVIYKSQTGIVMHDLRNDWIDNLYLLWGAAWFFEKKFDSAALMFQFINYAFAKKDKDGYYQYIGSRMDGNNALTVSTLENNKFPKNTVTPPSRNNAFIWQIRTMMELGNMAQSGTMIATLRNDPFFPERLRDDLEEVQSYWFYKQGLWDSSATHLVLALDQAKTKQERARWEYLAAQMFERSGKLAEAEKYYLKSIGHTTDPVMDIYARLNLVRINKSGGENYIDKNIAELVKMARRDKYADYRDVIYFMAAQMELERNNFLSAQQLLLKSAKFNNGNLASKNKSYLQIADLSFNQRKYLQAASFYDSVQTNDLTPLELDRLQQRRQLLSGIVSYQNIITREDSLQRIAAMPEEERTAYITRQVKQLRKLQGLEDEGAPTSGSSFINPTPVDLFPSPTQKSGEWYFYNSNLKTQGFQQFRSVWGSRPNVDNWRRFADVNQQLIAKVPTNSRDAGRPIETALSTENTPSFTSLLNNLPLSDAQRMVSNDSIQSAMYGLASIYLNDIEDYTSAIHQFEEIRRRFPDHPRMNEVLFQLYYSYKKSGDAAKADEIRKILIQKYPGSRYASIVETGQDPNLGQSASTKAYEDIYDLFIEGKFEEAIASKKTADSLYKTNSWQPQLLYIEAVYHIRQRSDSMAKNILQTLINQDPNDPLSMKAQNLMSVLSRRKQIEEELSRLEINRPPEDNTGSAPVTVQGPVIQRPIQGPVLQNNPPKDTSRNQPPSAIPPNTSRTNPVVDTSTRRNDPSVPHPPVPTNYRFEPQKKHFAMIILDKVDPLFVNEVKNAYNRYNRERFSAQPLEITIREIDAERKLVLIGNFATAQESLDYMQKAKRDAPSEVMPWMKADKYSFLITSETNLEVLIQKKDLVIYRQFLDQNLPGKF